MTIEFLLLLILAVYLTYVIFDWIFQYRSHKRTMEFLDELKQISLKIQRLNNGYIINSLNHTLSLISRHEEDLLDENPLRADEHLKIAKKEIQALLNSLNKS